MASNGKRLEGLVTYCEEALVPARFDVTANELVYDDGIQIAELDVMVRGRVGTTDLAWLIECRDHPSQGKAPNSWIEQLVSRRDRFNLSKVTAVSTTGFAPGVAEWAASKGIELREVVALTPEAFKSWFSVPHIQALTHQTTLRDVKFMVTDELTRKTEAAVRVALVGMTGASKILRAKDSGDMATPDEAFSAVTQLQEEV